MNQRSKPVSQSADEVELSASPQLPSHSQSSQHLPPRQLNFNGNREPMQRKSDSHQQHHQQEQQLQQHQRQMSQEQQHWSQDMKYDQNNVGRGVAIVRYFFLI